MDVPPAGDTAPQAQPVEPTAAELARRLDAVEAGLGRLGGRLESLAVSLEASFEAAVATEVHAAAAELRHTVSELGRILVRDLGKLPQMLTEHRQAIVAELRAIGGPKNPGVAATGASGVGRRGAEPVPFQSSDLDEAVGSDPDDDNGDQLGADVTPVEAVEATDTAVDSDGGDRNWRGHLRRHRQA